MTLFGDSTFNVPRRRTSFSEVFCKLEEFFVLGYGFRALGDEFEIGGEAVYEIEVFVGGGEASNCSVEFKEVGGDEEASIVDEGFNLSANAKFLVNVGREVDREKGSGMEFALGFNSHDVGKDGLHSGGFYAEDAGVELRTNF